MTTSSSDHDREIRRLLTTAPKAPESGWHRLTRWLSPLSLLVAVIAMVLALLSTSASNNVGECVNQNLGKRNQPAAADAQAHIDFANALARFVTISKPDQQAEAERLKTAIQNYADTLAADQAARDANPLGVC